MLDTQLLKFLDGKLASEEYIYQDSGCCAAAQFNRSIGREYPVTAALMDREFKSTFDGRLENVAYGHPRTFGAMRFRARKEFTEA
jgi:hypothetical protein